MTLVKKQYNGRELPVFDNMDEATEYFARRRETIYKGISALFLVFSAILGILQVLFDLPLIFILGGFVILHMGCFYCFIKEPKIRAPEQFIVFCLEEEEKWLLFPEDEYPAVAFVRENEDDTTEEDYTIDDYVVDVSEEDLKKNAVVVRIFAASIFLAVILMLIAPVLSIASVVGAAIVCMVILCW